MQEGARLLAMPSAVRFLWNGRCDPALATAANQTRRRECFARKPRLQEQARRFDTCSHVNVTLDECHSQDATIYLPNTSKKLLGQTKHRNQESLIVFMILRR